MKNSKVCVIGCGRIAGHHCESISETNGIDLIAVCDIDSGKAFQYGNQFGVNAFTNYHEMLYKHPEIDTVAIITPSGMHYEHALDIVTRYRKNIIVEKPTFMIPSQVKDIYAKAAEANVKVYPVFQNRHNLAVQRVLQGLGSGELGSIRSAAVRVRWCRQQRYYDLAPWRGTFSMDGGCLTNQGIHHIDLLRLIVGNVRCVSSVHKTLGAAIEVEDTVSASMEFESGAIGVLEITTAARPIDYEASISLVCEKGLAQIGGIAVNELQIYTPVPEDCIRFSEDFSGNVYGNGHIKIYEEIVQDFRGMKQFSVSFEDTFETIKLLNAFYLADESESWVNLEQALDSVRLGRPDNVLAKLYRTPSFY